MDWVNHRASGLQSLSLFYLFFLFCLFCLSYDDDSGLSLNVCYFCLVWFLSDLPMTMGCTDCWRANSHQFTMSLAGKDHGLLCRWGYPFGCNLNQHLCACSQAGDCSIHFDFWTRTLCLCLFGFWFIYTYFDWAHFDWLHYALLTHHNPFPFSSCSSWIPGG